MEVKVKQDGKYMKAKVSFAKQEDFAFAKNWADLVGDDQNPVRTDTVEYAALAIKKYEAAYGTGISPTVVKESNVVKLRQGGLWRN